MAADLDACVKMKRYLRLAAAIMTSIIIVGIFLLGFAAVIGTNKPDSIINEISFKLALKLVNDKDIQQNCVTYEARKKQYFLGKDIWYQCIVDSDCTYSSNHCRYVATSFKDMIESEIKYLMNTSQQCEVRFTPICDMSLFNHAPACNEGMCSYHVYDLLMGIHDGT